MRTTRLCLPSHQPAHAAANPDCAAAEKARRGSCAVLAVAAAIIAPAHAAEDRRPDPRCRAGRPGKHGQCCRRSRGPRQKIWYTAPMIDREAIIADAVNGETSKAIARRHGCTVKD